MLEDEQGRVLVAQRPEGKSLAGGWEFPGGKLHEGEGRLEGLARELHEELGIRIEPASCRPLIRYLHAYAGLEVVLDAWRVGRWTGTLQLLEHQALDWRRPARLLDTGLLPADAAIVKAIRLPALLAITPPEADRGEERFLDDIEALGATLGRGLVCVRRPDLDAARLVALAGGAACRLEGSATRLLLHGEPNTLWPALQEARDAAAERFQVAAGIHMPGRCLEALRSRPIPEAAWLGASCHDATQLARAASIGVDYAFLGPVKATASHPGQPGMGWEKFEELVRDLPLPVYAIGGLAPEDLETAWAHGAQGIAAIRSLWPKG